MVVLTPYVFVNSNLYCVDCKHFPGVGGYCEKGKLSVTETSFCQTYMVRVKRAFDLEEGMEFDMYQSGILVFIPNGDRVKVVELEAVYGFEERK